ncbi:MAG TPA: alpha/beta fold hydrolase [Candidatus Rubrimentiphilum sp.]|nr:alpha/beta fold hydrolase [Candidatus Rubrimentiphilum sp.]
MQKIKRDKFLVLTGGAVAASALPLPSFASESDLVLRTATGSISGTLLMPAGSKPVPVVLLIAGSGPTDRDGNNPTLPGKNDALKLLANAMAARGIATLRFDKRGIGASAAAMTAEKDIRFDTYIDDAAGWIKLLRANPRCAKITVAGHSEGSLLGAIAAQRGNVAAYVSLEGAGRPAYTVLREQLRPALAPASLVQADAIMAQLKAGNVYTGDIPAGLEGLFRPSIQPYLISWFKYDPAVEVGKLRIPVTIVQGTADVQVTMADAEALKSGSPSAKLVVVQGMNHVLKISPDTSSQAAIVAGYSNPKLPVAPQVIDAVASAAKGTR